MIIQYLKSCSSKVHSKWVVDRHINSAIELLYQVHRHDLMIPKEQLPSILGYDWSQKKSLEPQVVGYFFTYLTRC